VDDPVDDDGVPAGGRQVAMRRGPGA
jgi:hypothetical protein